MRRTERGFTLVELMVSLVVFSFAIAGVLSVAVSLAQGFRDQRAAVGAESSTRVPTDFIADALRQSSPGAPTAIIVDQIGAGCTTSALTVTNNVTAIGTGTGYDLLDVVYASGAVVTSSRTAWTSGTASGSLTVTDASQLAIGDSIVLSNVAQGHLLKITGIAGNVLTVTGCSTNFPAGDYPIGSIVVRAQHARFWIGLIDGVPTLMMNPTGDPANDTTTASQPLAEGIEDIQIALAVDKSNNAATPVVENTPPDTVDDWIYNAAGDVLPAGTLRAVRVTMIARTTSGYIGNAAPFNRPAAEDHAAGTTFDTYRRRVLRTIVEMRNIGESP